MVPLATSSIGDSELIINFQEAYARLFSNCYNKQGIQSNLPSYTPMNQGAICAKVYQIKGKNCGLIPDHVCQIIVKSHHDKVKGQTPRFFNDVFGQNLSADCGLDQATWFLPATRFLVIMIICAKIIFKSHHERRSCWPNTILEHIQKKHKRTYTHTHKNTHKHTDRVNFICPSAI